METPTELSPEDQALRDQADAARANLEHNVQTASKGDEKIPMRIEPSAARKGIYKKSGEMHEAELAKVMEDNPNVAAHVAQLRAEVGGGEAPAPAATPPTPASTPQSAPGTRTPSQATGEYVTIQHKGKPLSVARSDIERAGGEDSYLRRRELDDLEAELARQARVQEVRKRELDATEQRLAAQAEPRQTSAGQGAPAGPSTPAAPTGDESAKRSERAKALAAMIYSGDPEEATRAIEQILSEKQPGQVIDPNEVARLATERLKAEQAAVQAQQRQNAAPPPTDPVWERTRLRINAMARDKFPAINNDPNLSKRARDEMVRRFNLPENANRRAEDIAYEACAHVAAEAGRAQQQVRQDRQDMKRGLPPAPQAGGSAPAADEQIPSDSDYVEMMRKRRSF